MTDWVSLCRMPRDARFPVFLSILREAGVEYFVPDEHGSSLWGGGVFLRSRILVPEDQLREAEELLEEFRSVDAD